MELPGGFEEVEAVQEGGLEGGFWGWRFVFRMEPHGSGGDVVDVGEGGEEVGARVVGELGDAVEGGGDGGEVVFGFEHEKKIIFDRISNKNYGV